MTTQQEQGIAGTILHIEDSRFDKDAMTRAFERSFQCPSAPGQSLHVGDVTYHSFPTAKDAQAFVAEEDCIVAMLTVGMIVAIIDGELEARSWGYFVQGSEVASDLRRRVKKVLIGHKEQFAGRTVENSLQIIAYSGRSQNFGDINLEKGTIRPIEVMETHVRPQLVRR